MNTPFQKINKKILSDWSCLLLRKNRGVDSCAGKRAFFDGTYSGEEPLFPPQF